MRPVINDDFDRLTRTYTIHVNQGGNQNATTVGIESYIANGMCEITVNRQMTDDIWEHLRTEDLDRFDMEFTFEPTMTVTTLSESQRRDTIIERFRTTDREMMVHRRYRRTNGKATLHFQYNEGETTCLYDDDQGQLDLLPDQIMNSGVRDKFERTAMNAIDNSNDILRCIQEELSVLNIWVQLWIRHMDHDEPAGATIINLRISVDPANHIRFIFIGRTPEAKEIIKQLNEKKLTKIKIIERLR